MPATANLAILWVILRQLNGQANAFSDIYSLGVVLYELLTGQRPFTGSLGDLIVSIRNETPPKPSSLQPGLDDQLEAICLKCMAREPEDRYQSADELSVALNEYLQHIAAQSHDENHDRLTRRAVIRLCTTVAFVLLAGITIFLRTGEGTVEIEIDDKSSTLLVDGKAVKVESGTVKVSVGRHEIEIVRKDGRKHATKINILWRHQKAAVETHRILGTVFNDANGDGQRQRGEEPLPNRRIWLDLNRDGLLDANEPRQNTDELGEFRFTGLIPDRYVVRQEVENGWEQTSPGELIYDEDFSSDPGWITQHPDRYRWDAASGEFVLTQRNVNGSDSEYVFHDIGFAFGSFRLEYELLPVDRSYASGVTFGLFDSDMITDGQESCAFVSTNFADVAPGKQAFFADMRLFNSEGRGPSTQSSVGVADPPSDPWVFLEPGQWYRVVMVYDAESKQLSAEFRNRDSDGLIRRLLIPDAGTFAPDMTRLASSNCRPGKFYAANAESTIRIDNLKLFITSGQPFVVDLPGEAPSPALAFGNRQLATLEGQVWIDTDQSGQLDNDERGLAGQIVFIDENGNGQADTGEPVTVTDTSGRYKFKHLRPGIHIVAVTHPDAYDVTFPLPRDWKQFRSGWYALTRMNGSWELCEGDARAAGGHLVTISDAAESTWLTKQYRDELMPKRPEDKLSTAVWIGLHRQSGLWEWSSGESPGFHAGWWNHEPYEGTGTDHVALLTAEQRRGVWHNGYGRPAIAGDWPRGVIELPVGQQPRPRCSHAIEVNAAETLNRIDFGLTRSR